MLESVQSVSLKRKIVHALLSAVYGGTHIFDTYIAILSLIQIKDYAEFYVADEAAREEIAFLFGISVGAYIAVQEALLAYTHLQRRALTHGCCGAISCKKCLAVSIAMPAAMVDGAFNFTAIKAFLAYRKSNLAIPLASIGAGFINFFLNQSAKYQVIKDILKAGQQYGRSQLGSGKTIHLEFVSSNPTGPLHVGHGRSAAYGAAVGDLLEAVGYKIHREYYVNDGGRQMDILATSTWLRYLQNCGETFIFPSNGYQGDYVITIAEQIKKSAGERLRQSADEVFKDIPADEPQGGDKEIHIDALIARAKALLGPVDYQLVFDAALTTILADIRDDLAEFGVQYQDWFSERKLIENGATERTITKLKANGYLYEKEGAWWFRSTDFGDDKDRVVVRENGQLTYFATDIAHYQFNLDRGFYQLINVLGADHHGYVMRVRAAIQALGYDPTQFITPMVQFAVLYRGKERVQMSTRSGSFVTLRELREEVGTEAARFFYILRKCEQHMDFDLELAKSQSNENPLYYLQYAHARICSVFRQLKEKQLTWDQAAGLVSGV